MTPRPTSDRRPATTFLPRPSPTRRRLLTAAGATAALSLTRSAAPVRGQATPDATPSGETEIFEIPGERVFPEGIAFDSANDLFYVGSTEDGAVYRGDLATGVVESFLAAGDNDRTAVTGLKVDGDGRLIVCGRQTGRIFVYDTASGELLARYANGLGDGETLVNDAATTPDGVAYVTDSFAPSIYRVDLASLPASGADAATPTADISEQEAEVFLDLTDTAFEYVADDFNANGIVASGDGAALLVVQFTTGLLFRVDVATREIATVDIAGGDLTGGDGMVLDGTTLWVLLDSTGELLRVQMDDSLTRGEIVERFTDPSFNYPTTLALVGDGTALVVNSQLDMAGGGGTPDLPFTVSRIQLPG